MWHVLTDKASQGYIEQDRHPQQASGDESNCNHKQALCLVIICKGAPAECMPI